VKEFFDTIVAPITGVYRAPVAILRVSGSNSWEIAKKIFRTKEKTDFSAKRCYFGEIFYGDEIIDEGFLVLFEEGKSYTGEQCFELSCHGSPVVVRRVLTLIQDLGARQARPGEFTERAFLNGRIDLTQAEAVSEIIQSSTEIQQKRARLLQQGKLSEKIHGIEERIARQLALVEATVDFSEEIGELDKESCYNELNQIIEDIQKILEGYNASRLIREGLKVAIVGRPNVGKSSLFNALLGTDRAIVTEIPGTTRDTIEETVAIKGYPVVFTDTAGIRETQDVAESLGVERSRNAVENADIVCFVYEAPPGWLNEDEKLLSLLNKLPDVFIANKSDMGISSGIDESHIVVSALTGAGVERFADRLVFSFEEVPEIPLINDRHKQDLEQAIEYLKHSCETLQTDLPVDLACVDIRGALESVGKITGRTASEEIIERVFREFCVGK
jgi:tRNA modification GTPase